MYNNCNIHPPSNRNIDPAQPIPSTSDTQSYTRDNVRVVIVEQPASKNLRFRYICEGRSAGSIPGINSTADNKTAPSIWVDGYDGPAVVVVSCVTKNKPYWPHPHNLVGKDVGDKGVLTLNFDTKNIVTFNGLGIQCVRRNEVDESLQKRERLKIDPFRTGYNHRKNPKVIDLNVVRLCFQTFLNKPDGGHTPLKPVVSEPIYDKKSKNDLTIVDISANSSSVAGGKKIILLCEKVVKDDIAVRFFEEIDGKTVWEAYGYFTQKQVHRQVAISFKTPPYKTIDVEYSVSVYMQIQRMSDKMTSEPREFFYTPDEAEITKRKKRRKIENSYPPEMFKYLTDNAELEMRQRMQHQSQLCAGLVSDQNAAGFLAVPKAEYNPPNVYNIMCAGPSFSQRPGNFQSIQAGPSNAQTVYMVNSFQPQSFHQDFNLGAPTVDDNDGAGHAASSSASHHLANWNMSKNTTIQQETYGYPVSYAQQEPPNYELQQQQQQQTNQQINNFDNLEASTIGGAYAISNVHNHHKQEPVAGDEIDDMTDSFSNIL